MDERYLPKTPEGRMDRLMEECGEVTEVIGRLLRILGKTRRFGLDSKHPNGGPTNAQQLLSELRDLQHAANAVEVDILDHYIAKTEAA